MDVTDSQTLVLGPNASQEFGWFCGGNRDIQAIASAIAIPEDPNTLASFPINGAVIALSGPIYYYAGTVFQPNIGRSVQQYIVRWAIKNRSNNWHAIRLSYTVVSSTPIETVPGIPNKIGGE